MVLGGGVWAKKRRIRGKSKRGMARIPNLGVRTWVSSYAQEQGQGRSKGKEA